MPHYIKQISTLLVSSFAIGGQSAAYGQAGASSDSIMLKLSSKVNDRFEYRVKVGLKLETGGTLNATIHVADRTVGVFSDSLGQSVYVAGLSVMATGALNNDTTKGPFEALRRASWMRTVDFKGKVLNSSSDNALTENLMGALDLVLPGGVVSRGQSWVTSANIQPSGKVDVKYTLVDFNQTDATVKAVVVNSDKVTMVQDYVFVVDRKSGRYRSASGAMKVDIGGEKATVTTSAKMLIPVQPQSSWKDGK